MSSWFGKPNTSKINTVIKQMSGSDETAEAVYKKEIVFERGDVYNGFVVEVDEFFKNEYCNVRPKQLVISCKNENSEETENVTMWYFHTPLVGQYVNYETLQGFKMQYKFNENVEIQNTSPYMTSYQLEGDEVVEIGMHQLANVNIVPYRKSGMSVGQLFFELKRKSDKDVKLEVTMKLNYTKRDY